MTSLHQIGLAWRRRQTQSQAAPSVYGTSNDSNKRHHDASPSRMMMPVLTTSGSGDSASDSHSPTTMPLSSACKTKAPRTPEGLRPRKALEVIREELHLPFDVLQQLPRYPQNVLYHPAATTNHNNTAAVGVISPKVTNSSFYSRSSSSTIRIAESPDLGTAKTAVGALVGETKPRRTVDILPPKLLLRNTESTMRVLPPRSMWQSSDGTNDDDDEQEQELLVQDGHRNDQEDDEEDETKYEPLPYHQLNDSHDLAQESHLVLRSSSPVSTDASSSFRGSEASSWHHPRHDDWEMQQQSRHVSFADDLSFSSRRGLVEDLPTDCVYNFDSIQVDQPPSDHQQHYVVAVDDHMTTVSAMSHSTNPTNTSHNDSIHSLDSIQDSRTTSTSTYRLDQQYSSLYQPQYSEDLLENALLQRKSQQQRRAKEQLLLGIIQRLQQDMELVRTVESMRDDDACFLRTPVDREGLVVGFGIDKRQRLTGYLDAILSEMDVARTDEFFLSPSQFQGVVGETHHDLREAMTFVCRLVQQAFPKDEFQQLQPAWKCKSSIRDAMGMQSIPESPETVRGGDTSLFSLPSECSTTPHTSNRSMATTITSKPSPYKGAVASPRAASKPTTNEAGQIRYTIEVMTTLLQRMTLACDTLLGAKCSAEETILATEAIKRNYLQLVALPTCDLHSVLDAFITQDSENNADGEVAPGLTRKVSEDDDQNNDHKNTSMPPRLIRSTVPRVSSKQQLLSKFDEESTTANDMFSPTTDDMKSTISVRIEDDSTTYDDDLRRIIGSNDCEEGGEDEREDTSSPDSRASSDSNRSYGRILNKLSETGGYQDYMCEMEQTITPRMH